MKLLPGTSTGVQGEVTIYADRMTVRPERPTTLSGTTALQEKVPPASLGPGIGPSLERH